MTHVKSAVAAMAVAAVTAGAAAYVMNHSTCRSRKRAIRRAAGKMSDFMSSAARELSGLMG